MRTLGVVLSSAVLTMCEGGAVPERCCEPTDRLDVLMRPAPDWQQRCLSWGGTPDLADLDVYRCMGVDF